MNRPTESRKIVPAEALAALAAGDCGVQQREALIDQLAADRQAALELQLLLALAAPADQLARELRPAASARRVGWQWLLPAGAAALMLAVWPQQLQTDLDSVALPQLPVANQQLLAQNDDLLSVSFEASDGFSGGFE